MLVEDRTYADAFLHVDRAESNRANRAALRQGLRILTGRRCETIYTTCMAIGCWVLTVKTRSTARTQRIWVLCVRLRRFIFLLKSVVNT